MAGARTPARTESAGPSIGVAIPVYNGGVYLGEQLQSILTQARPPDEIIVSDDGSTDASVAIARSFDESASTSMKLIEGEHVGLRRNVERALRACRAEVIVLADQDDVWTPGKLEAVAAAFADPAVSLWFSDADLVDASAARLGRSAWQSAAVDDATRASIEAGRGLPRLIHGQTVTGATMAFRRSVLEVALPLPAELEPPDHLMLHDGWLAVLASLLGTSVTEPRKLTLYRQHAGQVTGMAMAGHGTQNAARSSTHANPRTHLEIDHRRVRLVLERLRQREALARCRPDDAEWLAAIDEFYSARLTVGVALRLRAIARQARRGSYRQFARGWRTAVADIMRSRPARGRER